jgi:hypothetical protein
MDISINYFCNRAISFRNNFLTYLTALQKKILVVGSGALKFLAGCYAINRCCFKAKVPKKETFDVPKAKEISNKEKSHVDPVELLPQEKVPKKETFDVPKAKEISNKEKSQRAPVELLPEEMLLHILTFLKDDLKSLSSVSQTKCLKKSYLFYL